MRTNVSMDQLMVALEVATTLGRAIVEAGPGGVPSGHLYAVAAMPAGLSLDSYEGAIGMLKKLGMVTEEAHVLRAAGKLAALR